MKYTKDDLDAAWCHGWLDGWRGYDAIRPFAEGWKYLPPHGDPSAYDAKRRCISLEEACEWIRQSHTKRIEIK